MNIRIKINAVYATERDLAVDIPNGMDAHDYITTKVPHMLNWEWEEMTDESPITSIVESDLDEYAKRIHDERKEIL